MAADAGQPGMGRRPEAVTSGGWSCGGLLDAYRLGEPRPVPAGAIDPRK